MSATEGTARGEAIDEGPPGPKRDSGLAARDAGPQPPPLSDWRGALPGAAFADPDAVLVRARAASGSRDREVLLRKAAQMYEDALRAAPAHKDAARAGMQAASLFLELGEPRRAIDAYKLLISAGGKDAVLDLLRHGETHEVAEFKVVQPPRPDEYNERITSLAEASEALASVYERYFTYRDAAGAFVAIAENPRFDPARRGRAVRTAMELYTALGDAEWVAQLHELATSPALHPDEAERAHADYLYASCAYRLGIARTTAPVGDPDRAKAIAALARFHERYKGRPAAAGFVVEAAYRVAQMKRSAGDATYRAWFKTTLADWRYMDAHPPAQGPGAANGSPYAEYRDDAESLLAESPSKAPPGIVGHLSPATMPSPLPPPALCPAGLQPIWHGDFDRPDWLATWDSGARFLYGEANASLQTDSVAGHVLRVRYPAGSSSASYARLGHPLGGLEFKVRLPDTGARAVYLSYRLRFAPNFPWAKGGKLPGICGGSCPSGGAPVTGYGGWSMRLMWRGGAAGEQYAYILPAKEYGTELGLGSWHFAAGDWHRVVQQITLNTPGAADGGSRVWYDADPAGGPTFEAEGLTYRLDDTPADTLFFSTFFGGHGPEWTTPVDTYVDFAEFVVCR